MALVPSLSRYSYHRCISVQVCSKNRRCQVACAFTHRNTFSDEELHRRVRPRWRHYMNAGSHQIFAKLQNVILEVRSILQHPSFLLLSYATACFRSVEVPLKSVIGSTFLHLLVIDLN